MPLIEPIVAAGMAAIVGAKSAQDAALEPSAEPAFELSFNLALVSEYRGRGVSYSDDEIALQGGIDLVEKSGWSFGLWASTLAKDADADLELDFYGARSFALGAAEISFGASLYTFPGAEDWDFGEAQASLAIPLGPIDATFFVNYAWEQENLGDQDNVYAGMNWTSPLGRLWGAPLSLGGSIGYEEGPFAIQGEKLDFSLSLTAEIEEIAFAVSYVDNNLQGAEGHAAWIFSISRTF